MKYFILLALSLFSGVGLCEEYYERPINALLDLIKNRHLIKDDGQYAKPLCQYKDCLYPSDGCEYITYWYYHGRRNYDRVEVHHNRPETLAILPKRKNWKFLFHGYAGSKNDAPGAQLREIYQELGFKVMVVDYAPLVKYGCYHTAVKLIPHIAKCSAEFIDNLQYKEIFWPSKLHLIGFDMGAEIAGDIHNHSKRRRPRRVTGLSPLSPYFDQVKQYLGTGSGRFVDIIHGGGYFNGSISPRGHVDFFPNGGFAQRGCDDYESSGPHPCSRLRTVEYFAESIKSKNGFWGISCNSLEKFYQGECHSGENQMVIMGEKTSSKSRGTYYLQTDIHPPYALGKHNVSAQLFSEEPLL